MMDPAWEVKKKGTIEKNHGNEVVEEGTSYYGHGSQRGD